MWWNILKKPYIIETDANKPRLTHTGYSNFPKQSWKFNRLYQGSQGEEDTGYWTPKLTEALVYAFLGSHTGKTKDVAKPMIKQALMTKEKKLLEYDDEYGSPAQTSLQDDVVTPRGIATDNFDFKYLPDSRVKELAEQILENLIAEIEGRYELSYDEEEAIMSSARVSFKEAKIHFEHMLNKYF
jgi:hypothetical protein